MRPESYARCCSRTSSCSNFGRSLREDRSVRWCLLFVLTGALFAGDGPTPVVVELFTSEGCSSCPPADELLIRLHEKQPVRGVKIIVLSEHVDYWNNLGWVDPFSDKQFTKRQNWYSTRWPWRLYTPQVVIDGQAERVGSQGKDILAVIRETAKQRKATVELEISDGAARVSIAELPEAVGADVWMAVLEDGLATEVRHGENQGRTMPHVAVTRRLEKIGEIEDGASAWGRSFEPEVDSDWDSGNLRMAVFVQEHGTRRIVGAAAGDWR